MDKQEKLNFPAYCATNMYKIEERIIGYKNGAGAYLMALGNEGSEVGEDQYIRYRIRNNYA